MSEISITTLSRRYQTVELVTQASLLGLAVLVAAFWRQIPHAGWVLAAYLGLFISIELCNRAYWRWQAWAFWRVAYHFFPVTTILGLFSLLVFTIPYVNPIEKDPWVRAFDLWLFGVDPAIAMERYAFPVLVDVLEVCYALYFYYPLVVLTALYTADRRAAFERCTTAMGINCYLSFFFYHMIPVVGPRRNPDMVFQGPLQGAYMHETMHAFLNASEMTIRNCFPSAHTSLSLVVLFLAFRYYRPIFWVILLPIVGLIFATIFLRYHYMADLLAGVLSAVLTLWAADALIAWVERKRQGHAASPDDQGRRVSPVNS